MKLFVALALAFSVNICRGAINVVNDEPSPGSPPTTQNQMAEYFTNKITKFTLGLDRTIEAEGQNESNILFSPLNLAGTMYLMLLGSGGSTFDSISKAFDLGNGFPIDENSETFHKMFSEQVLSKLSPNTTLAFGLYLQEGQKLRKQFLDLSSTAYKSMVKTLDFVHEPEKAQKTINDWISEQTHGMIPNLIDDPPSKDTGLVIATAAYFDDRWVEPFEAGSPYNFNVSPTEKVSVESLFDTRDLKYTKNGTLNLEMVAFPYKGKTTMYVILPSEQDAYNLANFKSKLTPELIEKLIGDLTYKYVDITFPKMKLSSSYKLKNAFSKMGMASLFSDTADMRILNGVEKAKINTDGWSIDKVRNGDNLTPANLVVADLDHKVEMEITKTGTTAAAATSIKFETLSLRHSIGVQFNRPFIFFIRDDDTKAITFWGSIRKPTPFSEAKD